MPITEQDLAEIKNRGSLFQFLKEKLGWPVDPDDTFTYDVKIDAELPSLPVVSRIVPFHEHDPFVILLAEFPEGYKRSDLRLILRDIRRSIRERGAFGGSSIEELIFICPSHDYGSVSFVHFEEQEGRQPRIEVFGWEADSVGETRTLRELNLPQLAIPQSGLTGEVDWIAGHKQWLTAWDVEQVTRKFFDEYKTVFESVEKSIAGVKGNKRLFTQRLFNRLMFIQFLSKKRWLRFPDINGSHDYLNAIFAASKNSDEDFYSDRLYWAFFSGLGTNNDIEEAHSLAELRERRGFVPYLNGGLFDMVDEDDVQGAVTIPNNVFAEILRMFSDYNFTITESTPADVTVAVDPEMLGRVFEKLITGRHESGSYYTPRSVVSFMCREALKGYLSVGHPNIHPSVARFVDDGDATGLNDPEAVLTALKEITVCDPACGSGAYLLGMMHELLRLREKLFAAKVRDHAKTYDRKLEIIEKNVYGVDKDAFAVNVAMLRLWLSLVVDDERDPLADASVRVALPNLRYKIVVGDSLTAPAPEVSKLTLAEREYMEEAMRMGQLHHLYFGLTRHRPNSVTKSDIEDQIREAKKEIQELLGAESPRGAMDWRSEFAEVFALQMPFIVGGDKLMLVKEEQAQQKLSQPSAGGGFHVILANPPYVRADPQFRHLVDDELSRQKAIFDYKQYRSSLVRSKMYATLYEKWDLYIPFLERAYQLLQPGGRMIFIIPDAFNASKYAKKAHEFILQHMQVERIDFCSEIDLFDAGVNNTIVHFSKSRPLASHAPARVRRWGKDRRFFDTHAETLPTFPQVEYGASLFKPTIESNDDLSLPTLGQLCYISVGMVIHANEKGSLGEFKAEDLVRDDVDIDHPKAYVEGKDIAIWGLRRVRYLEYGTARAPGLFRRPTFPQLHEAKEKLLAMRMCGENPAVTLDKQGLYSNHTVIIFVPWHDLKGLQNRSIRKTAKYRSETRLSEVPPALFRDDLELESIAFDPRYLLAVMNSGFAKRWLSQKRVNKLDIYPDDWKGLPIARASDVEQSAIAELAQRCLDVNGFDCEDLVAEINARIEALYVQ